jgi:hypothetical protein
VESKEEEIMMKAKNRILMGTGILLVFAIFALVFRASPGKTDEEAEIVGYTYYWNEFKMAWLIAPGTHVEGKKGQLFRQDDSDGNGYYILCLSGIPQQERTGIWKLTAVYQNYYCDGGEVYYPGSGKVYHNFYMYPCERR